jgi:anti-anti-sigma regulatory factor
MLRITTEEKNSVTRFRLEGKLIGDWVKELERCWIRAEHDGQMRHFVVNLNSVSFVDAQGKTLLENMVAEGVELEANNPLMQAMAKSIVEHSHQVHT